MFTAEEKNKVLELGRAGATRSEIAQAVGISPRALEWYKRSGDLPYPNLRYNQGGAGRKRPKDCEKTGLLFGTRDWPERLEKVWKSWSPEERHNRRQGLLPYGELPGGLQHQKASNRNRSRRGGQK